MRMARAPVIKCSGVYYYGMVDRGVSSPLSLFLFRYLPSESNVFVCTMISPRTIIIYNNHQSPIQEAEDEKE